MTIETKSIQKPSGWLCVSRCSCGFEAKAFDRLAQIAGSGSITKVRAHQMNEHEKGPRSPSTPQPKIGVSHRRAVK